MSTSQTTSVGGKTVNTTFSGTIPKIYDEHLGTVFFEPYAMDLVRRVNALQPATILELACGTGRLTNHLRTAGAPQSVLTATDINPGMLDVAKANVTAPNVTWGVVDAGELPYESQSYDAIVCQFGIMFVPDKVKAYSEAYRVLKPGGSLIVNTWDSVEHNSIVDVFQRQLEMLFKENTPQFLTIPFSYVDETQMRDELAKAGFTDVSIELVALDGWSPSAESAATGMIEGNPVIGEIRALGEDAVTMILSDVTKAFREQFGAGEIKIPLRARVITARKI